MRPGLGLLRRQTLSAKLIAVMAALIVTACAIIGAISFITTRASMLSAYDDQVLTSSRDYGGCQEHEKSDPTSDCNRWQPPGMVGVWIGTDHQVKSCTVATGGSSLTNCRLTAADIRKLLALPAGKRPPPPQGSSTQPGGPGPLPAANSPLCTESFSSPGLAGGYRLTAVQDGDGDTFVTGLPLSTVNRQLGDVAVADVSVVLGVLVLAGLAGGLLIRISLRPLRRVAATAAHVADLPLDSGAVSLPPGVPDDDPRTEVGQVGAAFNRMLGQVARALSRRAASEARLRRFAADASHELRTPLAAIRGYAEFALRHPGPVPEEVAHALTRVQSESARMSVLVDDLLLLARLDAGRPLERDTVDLSRLAIDATSDARVAFPDHRWLLDLPDEPVLAAGDEHRLHQVLANLLSNAGKHTPPGTTVTTAIAVGPPGEIAVTVTDDGPGIPAELLPDVFERFARADTSRARSERNGDTGGSTGLGLAIVAAVVSAHSGSVAVTSKPGSTRFTIQLPGLTEASLSLIAGADGRSRGGRG